MRQLLCGLLVAGVFVLPASHAQVDDTAKAIVEKAIKAHGGADKLAKLQLRQEKAKFTRDIGGQSLTVTTDSLLSLPDRVKATTEADGQRPASTTIISGAKGWASVAGQTRELSAEQVKIQKERLLGDYLLTLTPLLKDKNLTLSPLGEIKVNDRPALGVKVSAKDQKDLDVYFDKESGLLVKSVMRVAFRMQEVDGDTFYGEYKELEGLKWPMKAVQYRDGIRFGETEITELRLLDRIDDSAFTKP